MDLRRLRVSRVLAGLSFTLCAVCSFFGVSSSVSGLRSGRGESKSSRSAEEIMWLHEEWLVAHDRSYDTQLEKTRRFEMFRENIQFIDEHNRPENNYSYTVGLNRFADLSHEEFASLYLSPYDANHTITAERLNQRVSDRYLYRQGDELPTSVDWRCEGAVGRVKDQGRCKSCWAFAAVAAIEGLNYITTGEFVPLSEQQILDCEMLGIGCCKPGHAKDAYEFIMMNAGISSDENYPYRRRKEKCQWNNEIVVSIDQYELLPSNSEISLQKAVASQPISVIIGSHCMAFQFYRSGIFDGACGEKLRHNMAVVGYDFEGKDYWIVKNSWGEEWGEGGYIRLERNVEDPAGKCGITTYASYPLMYLTSS